MRLSESVDLYLGDVARRCSQRTVDKYTWVLDKLVEELGRQFPVNEVSSEQCLAFLNRWNARAPKTKGSMYTPLNQMFEFCLSLDYIEKNPMAKIAYPKIPAPEDRGVKSVTFKDVQRCLEACETWTEKLCFGVLVYMGVRRAAANNLRWKDVDLEEGYMRFREKGGKFIRKPIPKPLYELLWAYRRSLSEGGLESNVPMAPQVSAEHTVAPPLSLSDYVIPSEGEVRSELRNDRFIWRVVKRVGARAGVDVHCHAFRAAFAVHYLESYDGDTIGLQNLMGHTNISTTQGYWRRLNKERAMEKVRDLDWGVSLSEPSAKPTVSRSVEVPDMARASGGGSLNEGVSLIEGRESTSPVAPEREIDQTQGSLPRPSMSEDDSVSHIDEAKRRSNSMTPSKLRGKDSNLEHMTSQKASKSPASKSSRVKKKSR